MEYRQKQLQPTQAQHQPTRKASLTCSNLLVIFEVNWFELSGIHNKTTGCMPRETKGAMEVLKSEQRGAEIPDQPVFPFQLYPVYDFRCLV
jgi:hypothetical protein